MRELRGSFEELISRENRARTEDYIHITLTDEDEVPDAISRLREVYPNIMRLDYDNSRTRAAALVDTLAQVEMCIRDRSGSVWTGAAVAK